MKKILKTAAAALAGMLAFGLAACTDGDKDYAPETPKFFDDWTAPTNSSSVTAMWDFSKNDAGFGEYDALLEDEKIEPSINPDTKEKGKGASLKPTYVKGKYNSDGFQLAAVTANLNSLDSCYYFTLTLDEPSNIQITAKGAGPKDPKRLIAIVDKDGKVVGKDNYESNTTIKAPTVKVKGAPAGEYKLYANGVRIVKIDASAKSDFTDELAVKAILFEETPDIGDAGNFKFAKKQEYEDKDFNPNGYYTSLKVAQILKDKATFLPPVYSATRDADGNLIAVKVKQVNDKGEDVEVPIDLTASVEWTVEKPEVVKVDKKEATLTGLSAGTTKVRARVGMFIAEFVVEVSGSAEFTLDTKDALTIEAVTGRVNFKALTTDNRDITNVVTWEIVEASDAGVATIKEGEVIGLKEGTLKVKASYTQGDGTKFEETSDKITVTKFDKILVTLLDTKSKKFPANGKVVMPLVSSWSQLITDTKSVNADDFAATFAMTVPNTDTSWMIANITSNVGAEDYPGILFEQSASTKAAMSTNVALVSFTVTVTPPSDKTLKLASVAGQFRANKKKITAVKVNGTDYKSGDANKDQRNFSATFESPLTISAATEIKFELDYEEYKNFGDKFSIGDIKLFFEKES